MNELKKGERDAFMNFIDNVNVEMRAPPHNPREDDYVFSTGDKVHWKTLDVEEEYDNEKFYIVGNGDRRCAISMADVKRLHLHKSPEWAHTTIPRLVRMF